jgi:hypothetical protein
MLPKLISMSPFTLSMAFFPPAPSTDRTEVGLHVMNLESILVYGYEYGQAYMTRPYMTTAPAQVQGRGSGGRQQPGGPAAGPASVGLGRP